MEIGPSYSDLAEDKIVLPDPSQFASRNGYYQTALHEAGHSTGHHDRMNRDTLKDGMAKRALGARSMPARNCGRRSAP